MVTYEDVLRYLNAEMPDIGGIFQPPTATIPRIPIIPGDGKEKILDPELFYRLQEQRRLAGGENDDGNTNIVDTTNNAGLTGLQGLAAALGFAANPIGTVAGYGLREGFKDFRNTGNFFGGNPTNIFRGIGERSDYGRDIDVANMAQARGITKQLLKDVPLGDPKGPNERDQGPGETGQGTFGGSTNDERFSDYS